MKKLYFFGLLAVMLAFGLIVLGCDNDTTTNNVITYTVTANGTAGTVTSTQLNFTFNAAVSGLTAEDITITAGTGAASKGALTGSGTSWSLGITDVSAGTIKVVITKNGIGSGEKTVIVHETGTTPITTAITYTVTANGTAGTVTSTQLDFTFSATVSGITAEDITITAGTGAASKGTLTGSDTNWSLGITDVSAGTIKVVIAKDGIESGEKTVTVNKAVTYTVTPNGTAGTVTSTQLDFTFSTAVNGLTEENITITAGTGLSSKETLTGSGTNWSLGITNVSAGTIKVTINKDGIESGEKTVTIYEDLTVGTTQENAISLSITQWKNGTVATGEAKWYKFEAASETSYRVQWKYSNNPASDNYTASLNVTAYQSDGTTIISGINGVTNGWDVPKTVYGVSGTVYLKVEPFLTYVGTYAIRFYDPATVAPQIPMSTPSTSTTPAPSILVSWSSISGVSGYRVYRSNTETGEYTKISSDITGNSTTISYNDTSVSTGNTYWYKVAAYNSIGEGDKSAAIQSGTIPNTSNTTEVITLYPVAAVPTDGTISNGTQVDWYKFTAVNGTFTYKVQWADASDKPDGSNYTGVVKVSVYKSDGTSISSSSFRGWTTGITISGESGTVYIKVVSVNSNSLFGTYGIKVSQQQ